MNIFYLDPFTRVNDNLCVNEDTNPINNDIISNEIPGNPNDINSRYQASFYENFGLDIVTETVFDYPYPYITEKTLRPISSKRPFIIVGSAESLNLLHSKGFYTFSSIIDESYDSIKNPASRFHCVCNSIKKFITQPIEKIQKDVDSISSILEHNFQNYLILEDIEICQLNL